jgi:hypothetical protein
MIYNGSCYSMSTPKYVQVFRFLSLKDMLRMATGRLVSPNAAPDMLTTNENTETMYSGVETTEF